MVNRWGATSTKADTIKRFGELFDEGDDPAEVAKRWNDAGFDDEGTQRWLEARGASIPRRHATSPTSA